MEKLDSVTVDNTSATRLSVLIGTREVVEATAPSVDKDKMPPPPRYTLMFPRVRNGMNEDDGQLLSDLQTVKLTRRPHLLETLCCCNMAIRFRLSSDQSDSFVLQIDEQDSFFTRNCRSGNARIRAKVFNPLRRLVLDFQRDVLQDQDSLLVFTANGTIHLGTVRRDWSSWKPQFGVLDADGRVLAEIKSVESDGSRDVVYKIVSLAESDVEVEVGTITKHWNGCLAEAMVNYDDFTIRFTGELDASVKATLLGAVYFMNLTLYEKSSRKVTKICVIVFIVILLMVAAVVALKYFGRHRFRW